MRLASANGKEWGTRKEWRGQGEKDIREGGGGGGGREGPNGREWRDKKCRNGDRVMYSHR